MAIAPIGWRWQSSFDGGDERCGDLLVDLKLHFRPLAPGTRVLLVVRGAAAAEEIPAWCRLTGHRLVEAVPPHFLVERKPD